MFGTFPLLAFSSAHLLQSEAGPICQAFFLFYERKTSLIKINQKRKKNHVYKRITAPNQSKL
jgi:hypothetical protein